LSELNGFSFLHIEHVCTLNVSLSVIIIATLLLCAHVRATQSDDNVLAAAADLLAKDAVMDTLYNYVQDLNGLVEWGSSTCDTSGMNAAAVTAAGNALVDKYFSPSVLQYYVVQNTNAVPANQVEVNLFVGRPPANNNNPLVIPFNTSAQLFAFIRNLYPQLAYSFSPPFSWLVSAPVVRIVHNDPAFEGRPTTAYVTANDRNEGYQCQNGVRVYRQQFNLYIHVFILNTQTGTWQFLKFSETNKYMTNHATSIQSGGTTVPLITQVAP